MHHFDETINQRVIDEELEGVQSGVLGDSDNIPSLGFGGNFNMLKGTETIKAKKRYSYQSDQL